MNNNDLLEDYSPSGASFTEICETVERGERVQFFRGEFAKAEYANLNKRVYPLSVLREAYEKILPEVKNRRLVGQLSHPSTPMVEPEKIAVYFPELELKENSLVGTAFPSSTPNGEIVKGLLKDGVKLGFSTRSTGSVAPYNGPLGEGLVVVKPGLTLRAIDIVFNPSAGTFPDVVTESAIYLGQTTKFSAVWDKLFG